ncbi:MAG: oligosaccharide flippase family protein [Syntrophobacteraceae bacterium]
MKDILSRQNINHTVVKGAAVNVLGTIGKIVGPAFFIVITRLYGPDTMGAFFIVYAMITSVVSLMVSGVNDGVMLFASKLQEEDPGKRDAALYQILANGFVLSLGACSALILFACMGGADLILSRYPQQGVLYGVRYVLFALPFYVIPVICISATQALIIMRWEAIIQGFLLPLSLLIFSVGFYFLTPTLDGLLHAYMASGVLITAVSLMVFSHYFSFGKLFNAIRHFRFSLPLITFAVPQNLNMTFNSFMSNLDVVMLGYFAFEPKTIGFYAMGAQIVRNIRQIKLAFSGIYSPIITRLYYRKDIQGMNNSFSMISRWTSTAALPAAFFVALYRDELLRLFHPTFTADTSFMILLLIPPILSCTFGLAGNILVMTGHSLWNLINSLTIVGVAALLNIVLIPRFGLIGAALSTVTAATIVSAMQLTESYFFVSSRISIHKIYKPYLAILPSAALIAWTSWFNDVNDGFMKAACALLGFGVFVLILWKLEIEEEDKRTFLFWRYRTTADYQAPSVDSGPRIL